MDPVIKQPSGINTATPTSYEPDCSDVVSLTVYTQKNGSLTKSIRITKEGVLKKNSSQCRLSEGEAKTVKLSFEKIPDFLQRLTSNQAISLGISQKANTKICSKKQKESLATGEYITRSLENYFFGQDIPGMLLLDCDGNEMTPQEVLETLEGLIPELSCAAKIITPSASANIYRKSTGEKVSDNNNAHIYLPVDDAAEIPRLGKTIFERLILAGYGRVEFSRDGKILIRTLIDKAVFSPERLVFEAPAILSNDLEYGTKEVQYIRGTYLKTKLVDHLNTADHIKYEVIHRKLCAAAKSASRVKREAYCKEESIALSKDKDITQHEARKIIESRCDQVLCGEDILYFDDDSNSTIREILKDPQSYADRTLADPAEPEYGGGRNKAKLFVNPNSGEVTVHSFAHGGRLYQLRHDVNDLKKIIEEGPKLAFPQYIDFISKAVLTTPEKEELLRTLRPKLNLNISILRDALKESENNLMVSANDTQVKYSTSETDVLNLDYGLAMNGGKAVVIENKFNQSLECWETLYHQPKQLELFYSNKLILINEKPQNLFKSWLSSKSRNSFDGIHFIPNKSTFKTGKQPIQQGGVYNLWHGYTVQPQKGDCSLILKHIYEVWCNKDTDMNNYLLDWVADMFQFPDRQGKTAIVLRSGQGAGKNIIADGVLAHILGTHALVANRADDFLGRFNSSLGQAVFVFINEAVWGGDKEKKGILKSLITDKFVMVEHKYFDRVKAKNYCHLLFASNESWVVPAEPGDRRYAYLDVSDHRRGDMQYFKSLSRQINNQGRSAFLYEMLNRDISKSNLTKLPENQSDQRLTDQLQAASNWVVFLYDLLSDPDFSSYRNIDNLFELLPDSSDFSWGKSSWQPSKELFYLMYSEFTKNMKDKHPLAKNILIRNLKKSVPGILSTGKVTGKAGRREPIINFPPLEKARKIFTEGTELDIPWED